MPFPRIVPLSFRALFSQISQILLCVFLTDSTDFTDATPTHCGEYLHQRTARPAPVTGQRILAGGRDMRRRMPHRGMQAGMKAGHYSRSGMRDKGENTCGIGVETSALCHRQAPITTDAPRFAALHSHRGPYAASVKSVRIKRGICEKKKKRRRHTTVPICGKKRLERPPQTAAVRSSPTGAHRTAHFIS